MISLDMELTVTSIVDAFLDRKDRVIKDFRIVSQHGIVLSLELSVSYYGEDNDERNYHVNRQVFMLFTGNTSVFIAAAPDDNRYLNYSSIPLEDWENTSNHNSCWRVDGVSSPLSALYIEMCDKINQMRKQDGDLESIAPINMHHFNRLSNHPLVQHVDVVFGSDHDSSNPNYFKKLIKITPR